MNMKHTFALLSTILLIASCDRDGSTQNGGIPVDSETVLYRVTGLTGLVEYGDELVAMTYPMNSREARIREENINAAQLGLSDERSSHDLKDQRDNHFIKVRDFGDETGHRFFYFERNASDALVFRGVCSGSWEKGRQSDSSLAVCDITYPSGNLIVYFEVSERAFIVHGEAIAKRVLEVVHAKR